MGEIYLLSLVVILACGLGIILRKLKLPLLVSYIIAGGILSAFHLAKPGALEFLSFIPEVGLAFLLFLVGMELDLSQFRTLGKNIFWATVSQIAITTTLLGTGLTFLGLDFKTAVLLGILTSFSSTILVVKLLLDQKELSSLHGRLTLGILLIEDLLAVFFLMGISVIGASGTGFSAWLVISVIFKGVVLVWAALVLGKKILPKIFTICAENHELLLLTAVGWCLGFVTLSLYLGFSLAIGAFLAGVSLGQSVYRIQISARVKPLRDFFIMIFFLDLGTGLSVSGLAGTIWVAAAILAYAVFVKPAIFSLIFIFFGHRARSAFQTGVYISSISEFSLIVLSFAIKQGFIDKGLLSSLIFSTGASFVISSMLITHQQWLYQKVGVILKKFERARLVHLGEEKIKALDRHAVLIGCHRSGEIILKALQKVYGENLVVLDFNPVIIEELKNAAVNCMYGDVADLEVLRELNLEKARLVVSTVRDLTDDLILLDYLEKVQSPAVVVMTASDIAEAIKLYERGAHHVSLPMNLEGNSIGRLIHDYHHAPIELAREREKKLGELKKMA